MNSSSFKDRFSLDFLDPQAANKPSDAPLPIGMEAALNAYGNQVIASLKTLPDQTSDLLGLAKLTGTRMETLLPVIQYLMSKRLLERVAEDPQGNDTYKVTEELAPGN
jgi:hypothetical protein